MQIMLIQTVISLQLICLVFSLAVADLATGSAEKNALYMHASPYLAMHGRDPVDWQEWNEKTVTRAKQEDKLLFVSSGYFSCHWCHVMQRESYQDATVAGLLNRHFIAVKVDRELDPDLDRRLMDFVEKVRGAAGWPPALKFATTERLLAGMVTTCVSSPPSDQDSKS